MRLPTYRLLATSTVLAVAITVTLPVSAQDVSDLRRQREQARQEEQEALEQVDLLRADDAVVKQTLDEIEALVNAQLAQVQGARQALDAAEAEVLHRQQMAVDAEQALASTLDEIKDRAVEAYVGTDTSIQPWLESGDPNRTAIRLALLDFTAGNERDLVDELRAVQAQRDEDVRLGEEARQEAERLRIEFESALDELEKRQTVQLGVQAELQARIDGWLTVAEERAAASDEFTDLIRRETAAASGLAPGSESLSGYIMPTAGSIGSAFGPRVHPIFGTVRQHTGVDIGARTGNPIWAAKDGRVLFAGSRGGYGNTVILVHGDGAVTTLYAHMSVIHANVGERVEQGDTIGEIGSTGFSTGPHLHFEVRVNGDPRDPAAFLP